MIILLNELQEIPSYMQFSMCVCHKQTDGEAPSCRAGQGSPARDTMGQVDVGLIC